MRIANFGEQESSGIPVLPRSDDGSTDDVAELLTFIKKLTHAVLGQKICFVNELDPAATSRSSFKQIASL